MTWYYWSCVKCGKKGFTEVRQFACHVGNTRIRLATDEEIKGVIKI